MDNTVILELQDVTYRYEGETLPVWEHLSCQFIQGKINAIVGPSGCGKSSILYLLDGLIPHMYEGELTGKVLLQGEDITQVLPRHRCNKIGFLMQNPESQFCTFTVEEELAFGMENLGYPSELMKQRIEDALSFVGMTGYESWELTQLSGGQKQKIAIASLLTTKPQVLLLDEPTANLDPESRKQVFELIVRLTREENITVILVEHNVMEIFQEVDHFLVLNKQGQVLASGKMPESLLPAYPTVVMHEAAPVGEQLLKIENLHFAYPVPKNQKRASKKIMKGLELAIHKQELLAIVGENGVGKTTLLRLIFNIQKPDAGQITLYGKPVGKYRIQELYNQIGLVFQDPENQFICNTVFEEMMFSLKRVKIPQAEKESRVETMLRRFHLEQEKEKSPFVLSQGQKRRLSVASMLLTNQQILFLDEPTFGQDYENCQELMMDMQSLVEQGITIVMITHDLSLVKQYATRVVEIEDGKILRNAPTKQYFAMREGGQG